jgi:hypothetical protein
MKYISNDVVLVPGIRYYLLKKPELSSQGLYLQAGMQLIKYASWTEEYTSAHMSNSGRYISFPMSDKNWEIPFGIGVKYPINNTRGIEMNVSTDLMGIYNWQTWQTIRVWFCLLLDKG